MRDLAETYVADFGELGFSAMVQTKEQPGEGTEIFLEIKQDELLGPEGYRQDAV